MDILKRIIKITLVFLLIIVLIVLKADQISRGPAEAPETYKKFPATNNCMVLCYHRILDKNLTYQVLGKLSKSRELTDYVVYTEDFKNQINTLLENDYVFLSLEQFMDCKTQKTFPNKSILLTFDDIDVSVYENAFPFLREKNIPYTLFIIAGGVGTRDFNNMKMASWEQLREMAASSRVSFGSHTYKMHDWELREQDYLIDGSLDSFKADLQQSKKLIEEEIGQPVEVLAYPYGYSNPQLEKVTAESGFKRAFILAPKIVDGGSNDYRLCRYLITKDNFKPILDSWK